MMTPKDYNEAVARLADVPARGPFVGRHEPHFTLAEEKEGYPKLREALKGYDTPLLTSEYRQAVKYSFERMFGYNSAKEADVIAEELIARGVTEIPNPFGPESVVAAHRERVSRSRK